MNKINLHDLLIELSIGNEEFFKFLRGKVVKLPLGAQDFSWGCFPITDDNEILTDIRLLVPKIVDKPTLMVNIHEYAHAYELYQVIGRSISKT